MANDSSRLPHADFTQHLLYLLWRDRRIGATIAIEIGRFHIVSPTVEGF